MKKAEFETLSLEYLDALFIEKYKRGFSYGLLGVVNDETKALAKDTLVDILKEDNESLENLNSKI